MSSTFRSRVIGGALLALSLSLVSGCAAISDSSGDETEFAPTLALDVSDITRIPQMKVGQSAYIYGLVGEARSYIVESSHPDIISSLALNVDDNTVHGIQPPRITAISPGMAEIKIRELPIVADAPPLRTYRIEVTG